MDNRNFPLFSVLKRISSERRFLLSIGSIFSLNALALPSQAQITQAVIQEILDGNQVYIQKNQARVRDNANFGQVVLTKKSRTGLAFNNGAAGRLGTHATVTVGQCVELEAGQLLVSGPVNGCVGGMTATVQGTLYVLEKPIIAAISSPDTSSLEDQLSALRERLNRLETGDISPHSTATPEDGTVKVLEGTVRVYADVQPQKKVTVNAGEKITIRQGILSPVTPMTAQEIAELLKGELFSDFRVSILPPGAGQALCQRFLPGSNCPINESPTDSVATAPIIPPPPSPAPGTIQPEQTAVVSVSCQREVNTYLANLKASLGNSWSPPKPPRKGMWQSVLSYAVTKDGKVQDMQVVQSSGYEPLDQAAIAHVRSVEQNFSPFPRCYPRDTLPVDQTFKLLFY